MQRREIRTPRPRSRHTGIYDNSSSRTLKWVAIGKPYHRAGIKQYRSRYCFGSPVGLARIGGKGLLGDGRGQIDFRGDNDRASQESMKPLDFSRLGRGRDEDGNGGRPAL
jgi:hypothetical protein